MDAAWQELAPLDEAEAGTCPFALFRHWFERAQRAQLLDFNAMALATATADGAPAVRVVLLRGFDERGFVFFTNYRSRKAEELRVNARAALVLFWSQLKRQVRIEGTVDLVGPAESDAYFRGRPRGHQLSALASPQSQVIASRSVLEEWMRAAEQQYEGMDDVPRPEHWGGYRVVPTALEFWQGGEQRLHDRLRYRHRGDGTWRCERLAP